jgi:peptidoglycan/xylan/chitin deacetylase (PgdA/CDA1 family)
LLTNGQPQENALIPALDIHIDLLKTWILEAGVPVVEIPPAPEGYNFVVCLTHDADFVNIRDHFFDHTMAGFLYRALFGSFINVLKTKIPISRVLRNWKAVLALPFVFIGRIKDIWFQFDRYVEIERGMKSTFFIIPFKKRRGEKVLSSKRAAKYDIMDIRSTIEGLVKEGHEIGVHGIDAWHSQEKGEQERQRICDVTGQNNVGIRMHWLLSDSRTFITLESAGYQYDSSLGYNDAIGFRNGTTQIFRPLGVSHLLELPLHIQDTALFYSGRMNVSEKQASKLCDVFVQKALRHGGVLTINWHQRSLAPERLWEVFYLQFLDKLKVCLPWFASATQAVDWYQKRREVSFEQTERLGEEPQMIVRTGKMKGGPGLLLRVSYPRKHLSKTLKDHCLSEHIEGYVDIPLERNSTANSVLILSDRFIPLN